MLKVGPYLKMHVQVWVSIPQIKLGAMPACFGLVFRRHYDLSADIFGPKRATDKWEKVACSTAKGPIHSAKIWWTLAEQLWSWLNSDRTVVECRLQESRGAHRGPPLSCLRRPVTRERRNFDAGDPAAGLNLHVRSCAHRQLLMPAFSNQISVI